MTIAFFVASVFQSLIVVMLNLPIQYTYYAFFCIRFILVSLYDNFFYKSKLQNLMKNTKLFASYNFIFKKFEFYIIIVIM